MNLSTPKLGFAGHKIVKIAVNDAFMTFNNGVKCRIEVLKKLGLSKGKYCLQTSDIIDNKRLKSSEKGHLESTKETRKSRKKLKLEEARKSSKEGTTYASGEF